MQILALERDRRDLPETERDAILRAEAQALWALQQEGFVRTAYFRRDRKLAVLILEAESAGECEAQLTRLPLVRNGYIEFELAPLAPYDGYARLFDRSAPGDAPFPKVDPPFGRPGLGCGAAIVRDGQLLLVQRKKPPEAGCWSLPGGKVDYREKVADAIVREIREELGVAIVLERFLGLVETPDVDQQHWVSPVYLARLTGGEPINREPDKHAAIAWRPLTAPPAPLASAARFAFAALVAPPT